MTEAHPESDVDYVPRLDDVANRLAEMLRPRDLCLTLGAGDLAGVPDQVISMLAGRR